MTDGTIFESIGAWAMGPGLKIIFIVVGAFVVDKIIDGIINRSIEHFVRSRNKSRDPEEIKQRAETLSDVANTSTTVILFFVALMMALPEVGIAIGPLLTGAGVVGLALGFGAQNLVRDFLSGLFIIIEDQFAIGDVIKIGDTAGVVEEMTLRRTVLRDLDGRQHTIPNGNIQVVSNYSKDWAQMNINIPVDYDTNIEHAVSVINKVGEELFQDGSLGPYVIEKPQVLGIDNFGDSSIDIKVIAKTKPLKQWDVTRAFRLKIKMAFDKEGISIPFPHRTIIQKKAK